MGERGKRTRKGPDLRSALRRSVRSLDRALAGPRAVLTCEQSRRLDALCVERFGIPSIVLMENAAIGLANAVTGTLDRAGGRGAAVLIACGPGNNGGDGLALARHLHNAACCSDLAVVLGASADRLRGDAAANLAIVQRMGIRLILAGSSPRKKLRTEARRLGRPLLVVDALLGTGLARAAAGPMLELIRACNELREGPDFAVLAVDVPSGIDADTGVPPAGGEAIEADATVTMAAMKPGLLARAGRRWSGVVGVTSIGAPGAAVRLAAAGGRRGPEPSPRTG